MTESKTERICAIQIAAAQERIADPEDGEAAISAALDLIEERVNARCVAQGRNIKVLVAAAALIGTLAAALALWPCSRRAKEKDRSA